MGNAKGIASTTTFLLRCVSQCSIWSRTSTIHRSFGSATVFLPQSPGDLGGMSLDLPCGGGSGTRGALKWDAAGCREAVSSRARAKQVKDETRPKRLRDLVLGVPLEYPLNDEYKEDEV